MATTTNQEKLSFTFPSYLRKSEQYDANYADIASRLTAAGFDESILAYTFGVSQETIERWKENPLFKVALEGGKEFQFKTLIAKGLLAAVGDDINNYKRTITRNAEGEVTKDVEVQQPKHIPPNHHLLMFFITNIAKQQGHKDWDLKPVAPTQDNRSITVNIDGAIESDRIEKFAKGFLTGKTDAD